MIAAALFLAAGSDATSAVRAEWSLRRAESARFDLAVTLCGDAGRIADYRRLQAQQQALEKRFRTAFGRSAVDWLVLDDRGDCENQGGFRRYVAAYDNALADAREAMGAE